MNAKPFQIALIGGASAATFVTLLALSIDPTTRANQRLDSIDQLLTQRLSLGADAAPHADVSRLAQTPLFVMTTGAAAYKEKTFALFGVSISPRRKAALLSIDGANPVWIAVGTTNGDIRLSDVGTNGVNLETPVGERQVMMSDGPPKTTKSNTPAPPAAGG